MKKEIPQAMIDQHMQLKQQWISEGSPGWFYEWLLDRIELRMEQEAKISQGHGIKIV